MVVLQQPLAEAGESPPRALDARKKWAGGETTKSLQNSWCCLAPFLQANVQGVDSFSILFNHRSFLLHRRFPWVSGGFLERRIPGKNGEGTPGNLDSGSQLRLPSNPPTSKGGGVVCHEFVALQRHGHSKGSAPKPRSTEYPTKTTVRNRVLIQHYPLQTSGFFFGLVENSLNWPSMAMRTSAQEERSQKTTVVMFWQDLAPEIPRLRPEQPATVNSTCPNT